MNRPILTLGDRFTPTARAFSPRCRPTAKIQLPVRVRSSTQVPMATKTSHHSTVILRFMNPRSTLAANTALAELNPPSSETLAVASVPVTRLGNTEVDASEHEERHERDEDARDARADDHVTVDEPDQQRENE